MAEQPTLTASSPAPGRDGPVAAFHFAPGDILDERFRIVREVGHGAMGTVYGAMDEKLGRRIALKCARGKYGLYLTPEVRNASEVSHRNVCRIFEIHTAQTPFGPVEFITMEFLEGQTLSLRLEEGPLPEAEARAIARQLAMGLAEAHQNGVIHGDVKTNNVILTRDCDGAGRAVITDFGLARSPDTEQRSACGTPGYMAPELWSGGRTTTTSDVYALGVVLFAMIGGRLPAEVAAESGIRPEPDWAAAANRKPPPMKRNWNGILARCLDPDPAGRYQNAGELALALNQAPDRRRLAIAAAGVLLAALTGVVTYRNATAPPDIVKLALLPLSVEGAEIPAATALGEDVASRLTGVRRRFTVFSPDDLRRRGASSAKEARTRLGATHAFQVSVRQSESRLHMAASPVDLASGQQIGRLTGDYTPGGLSMMARALIGTITGTFHLTEVAPVETVSAAASPISYRAWKL